MIRITRFDDAVEFFDELDYEDYESSYSVIENTDIQLKTKTVYTKTENLNYDQLIQYIETKMVFCKFIANKIDDNTVFVEMEVPDQKPTNGG